MDNNDLAFAALNSLNNSLANAANTVIASQTSRQDRNFSREMSDLAWQRNIEAWNMQNEYNLPINQYSRQLEGLQANGLNPNLVYGNSSAVSGAGGSVSPYRFEGYHSTAVPRLAGSSGLESFLSTRLLQSQVAAQEANNRLINARADNEEARTPGITAKSQEAAKRWDIIFNNIEQYGESVRATMAKEYWLGVSAQYGAEYAQDKRILSHYEAAMAQWLNETQIPGLDMTYRQYMEHCKAFLPGAQYAKFKADVLDIGSRMAYRAKQGALLDRKIVFQEYVNRLAKYGRSLGNDWVTLLISGIAEIFHLDPEQVVEKAINAAGESQQNVPPTYPGP